MMGLAVLNPSYETSGRRTQNAIIEGVAGAALSAGRDLGREGGQFCAVLGACRAGRAVPLRQLGTARRGPHFAAGIYRRSLALLSARGPPRPALRLPGAR